MTVGCGEEWTPTTGTEQLRAGLRPDWPDRPDTPSPYELRAAEMHDLRDQGAGPLALWTATTVPAGRYL